MAPAAASFNTWMLSISSGLRLLSGLPFEKPPALLTLLTSKGNPSITYSGSVPALMEPRDRPLLYALRVHRRYGRSDVLALLRTITDDDDVFHRLIAFYHGYDAEIYSGHLYFLILEAYIGNDQGGIPGSRYRKSAIRTRGDSSPRTFDRYAGAGYRLTRIIEHFTRDSQFGSDLPLCEDRTCQ